MKLIKSLLCVLIISLLSACGSKPVNIVETSVVKTIAENFLETKFREPQVLDSFVIDSQKDVDGKTLVSATLGFETDTAILTATFEATFSKDGTDWTATDKKFTILTIDVTQEADQSLARAVVQNDTTPLFDFTTQYLYNDAKLTYVSSEKVSETEVLFTFNYADQQLNWTYSQNSVVKAQFDVVDGWSYALSDWSYEESSDWSGHWKAEFYDLELVLRQTINDLTVTGDITVTRDMNGTNTIANTLSFSFTMDGKHYDATCVLYPRYGSTRYVKVNYGTGTDDWFVMALQLGGADSHIGSPTYFAIGNNAWQDGRLYPQK